LKSISILGSTGSIGQNTLEVIKKNQKHFKVVALAAHSNSLLLEKQIREFNPTIVALFDEERAKCLQRRVKQKVLSGIEGLKEVATIGDMIVSAISGSAGVIPTFHAAERGKDIALANKEVLVSAGSLFMEKVKRRGSKLLPIDSEHSAIFQCLEGQKGGQVKRLILTASGGPFYGWSKEQLKEVTLAQALKHPNYLMGKKNTLDSSTLMNKGLEMIEAHFLFGVPLEQIEVVIHPQQLIHSMVEFMDGSILAQMSEPNMQLPIQYALSYPERLPCLSMFDFTKARVLEFFLPDKAFICLELAKEALRVGKSLLPYMNKANEVLGKRFLQGEIKWGEIGEKLQKLMSSHRVENVVTLEEVLTIEKKAQKEAQHV
jgi:1-deoxy-D-xylulose-5-phosphate reductoisomerase